MSTSSSDSESELTTPQASKPPCTPSVDMIEDIVVTDQKDSETMEGKQKEISSRHHMLCMDAAIAYVSEKEKDLRSKSKVAYLNSLQSPRGALIVQSLILDCTVNGKPARLLKDDGAHINGLRKGFIN